MAVARDCNGAIDDGANQCPEETRYILCVVCKDLQGEGERVDVGAVVTDDAESEDDETEFAKAVEVREEDLC